MEEKGSFLDPSSSPTMDILRGIPMAEFLTPSTSPFLYILLNLGWGKEGPLIKHRFFHIFSLKSYFQTLLMSLFLANL